LLKTESLDNSFQEFPLAKPSWYMSHHTTLYIYSKHARNLWGVFIFILFLTSFPYFKGVCIKTIIPITLVRYEMVIAI